MAYIESDVTYCSEAEKENQSKRRRSKRLSQKTSSSFRLNEDPSFKRFVEIQRILFLDESYADWSLHDWQALEFEMGLLKPSLSRIAKPRIELIEKKIKIGVHNARIISNKNVKKNGGIKCKNYNFEAQYDKVGSPNILAGMTTDILTELPPYQPQSLPKVVNRELNRVFTQVHPLDLTRAVQNISPMQRSKKSEPNKNSISKSLWPYSIKQPNIDLTDFKNQANQVIEVSPPRCKNTAFTSKWPERTKVTIEKQTPPANKSRNLKESLLELYKDPKPIQTAEKSPSSKERVTLLDRLKFKPENRSNNDAKRKPFRNTEKFIGQHFRMVDIPTREVRSEFILSPSSEFFTDEFLDLPTFGDDDSQATLPSSLKENFKKVFGADSLNDIIGCEKIIYSLTERHIARLSLALKVECETLKRTIEHIITDDNFAALEDDAPSDSSIVQCSQSPPQRLFPSQRSQVSK